MTGMKRATPLAAAAALTIILTTCVACQQETQQDAQQGSPQARTRTQSQDPGQVQSQDPDQSQTEGGTRIEVQPRTQATGSTVAEIGIKRLEGQKPPEFKRPPELHLTSPAFGFNEQIPVRHTCTGEDLSPPLAWDTVPEGTGAFALICLDRDAPDQEFVHWILFDLPGDLRGLPEGVGPDTDLGEGARWGENSWGQIRYGGPCPPPGDEPHRYYYRLFALSVPLELEEGITRQELDAAMRPVYLGMAKLMGRYGR